MGAWGPGPLENDAAWDALGRLAEASPDDRAGLVLAAFSGAAQVWDVDDASWVVVAALLVAMARGPANFAGDRARVVGHVARTHGVETFAGLVGDRAVLRKPAVARAAREALDAVAASSELADLWANDPGFAAALDDLRAALAGGTSSWPASADAPSRSRPLRAACVPGTLVGLDLGDGRRGRAVYRVEAGESWMTVYEHVDRAGRPPAGTSEVLRSAVAFQTKVDDYKDMPAGWLPLEVVDAGRLPALPLTFRQPLGRHRQVTIVAPGRWDDPRPATQEECIGLEPWGVMWDPAEITERLTCHLVGTPHPNDDRRRVRLSRSLFRVVTRAEAEAALGLAHLAPDGRVDEELPYGPPEVALRLAIGLGLGRDDLVLAEIDDAALAVRPRRGPADPDDPASPTVAWARLVRGIALDAVHEIRATATGYEPVRPVSPLFP